MIGKQKILKSLRLVDYRTKLFLSFLLIIFIIVLISSMVLYGNVSSVLMQEAKHQSMNTVIQLKNATGSVHNEVMNFIKQIAYDMQIQYLADNYASMSYKDNQNFTERLSSLFAANTYLKTCYIYYFNHDKVWSQTDSWLGLVDLEQSKQAPFIKEMYLNYKNSQIEECLTTDEYGKTQLTFIKPIAQYNLNPNAVAIISMDLTFFKDLLKSMEIDPEANVYLVNDNKQIISALKNQDSYDLDMLQGNGSSITSGSGTEEQIYSYTYSETIKWWFVYSIPTKEIIKKIYFFKIAIIIIAVIFLFLGLLLSFIASKRLYKPISALLDLIRANDSNPSDSKKNDMEYLNANLQNLIISKRNIEEALNESMPILKNSFLLEVLNNEISWETIWDRLNYYHANIKDHCSYRVAVIGIDHYEVVKSEYSEKQLSMLAVYQGEIITSLISAYHHIHLEIVKFENCQMILVFSVDQANKKCEEDLVTAFLTNVHKQITENMKFTVSIGVGNQYNSIAEIGTSFKEANRALGYRVIKGCSVMIKSDELPHSDNWSYLYSDKLEREIIDSVRRRDGDQARAALADYFAFIKENIIRNIDIRYAFVHLLDITVRCLSGMGIDFYIIFPESENLYKQLLDMETVQEADVWFNEKYGRILEYIAVKKDKRCSRIVEKTQDYIDKNYQSPDISLDTLSQELHFSESYLGKLFRSEIGIPIKEYITCKRIQEAKIMLETSGKTIKDIGRSIGYDNDRSFINIFKKSEGLTPGEYRNQIIKKL